MGIPSEAKRARQKKQAAFIRKRLGERRASRLAQFLFAFSGRISKLPGYTRLYRSQQGTDGWETGPAEWAWRRPGFVWGWYLFFEWSERLDPAHWPHWAYVVEGESTPCAVCGGRIEQPGG